MILMIVGRAGSGKDSVADVFVQEYGAVKVALADPMKEFALEAFGFSTEQLWGPSETRNEVDGRFESLWWRESVLQSVSAKAEGFCRKLGLYGAEQALCHWAEAVAQPGVTPRRMLQTLGTEWGRTLDQNVWINHALKQAQEKLIAGVPMIVLPDGRFRNEVIRVKQSGAKVIRVLTDNPTDGTHASELEIDGMPGIWFDAQYLNRKRGLETLSKEIRFLSEIIYPPRFY